MKRFNFLLILTVLFVLAGCGGTDRYSIEKQYWQAKKLKDVIVNQPDAYKDADYDKAIRQLTKFNQKYPTDRLALEAELDIATLYMVKNEYEKARGQLRELIRHHSSSPLICSEALFLIGNSYQIEGDWDNALAEYQRLKEKYPQTTRGLNIPIYIAQYYKSRGMPRNMNAAFRDAIDYYKKLSQQFANTQLGFFASRSAGRCYMELKDWSGALNVFQNTLETYRGKIDVDDVLMNMAIIYAHELKMRDKAILVLQELVKDYPGSRFIKPAEFMLREWTRR